MLKEIADGLNGPPFQLGLSVFQLDALGPGRLLQVLSDVLCWIQGVESVDIRSEAPDETTMRVLMALRVLRFPPPREPEAL